MVAELLAHSDRPRCGYGDRLFIHALALSGEEHAFYALYDRMTGVVHTNEDRLDVEHVANSFVRTSIGERLGYNTGSEVSRYRDPLLDEGFDIARLASQVDR